MAGSIGYGWTVTVGGSAVGEVTDIGAPGATCEAVKVNYLDMPDKYNKYIAGLFEGGVISLEINWVAAQYATLRGYLGLTKDVVISNGTVTYTWEDTIVTKVGEMNVTPDAVIKAKFEYQTTGPCVIS